MIAMQNAFKCKDGSIGVGLRYEHYDQALAKCAHSIDFVEIHAENFFDEGGPTLQLLERITSLYPVSIHGTAMGLGSLVGVSTDYLDRFSALVRMVNPVYVSEHACFTWGESNGKPLHAGDLLPLQFNKQTMEALVANIDRAQQAIGRQLLIENIVTYIAYSENKFAEAEFLAEVAERTQCGLLIDLNNILVNLQNLTDGEPDKDARRWLSYIPECRVKELHLAGCAQPQPGKMVIDDHSQPVSPLCWDLYDYAAKRFPRAATLIEWDNNLPAWSVLLQEAAKAKARRATIGVPV